MSGCDHAIDHPGWRGCNVRCWHKRWCHWWAVLRSICCHRWRGWERQVEIMVSSGGTSFWYSQLTRVWKLTALEAGSSENDWKAETWSFGSQMFLCWFSDVYSPTAEPQTFSFLNSFYCFGASYNDDSDAEPHDLYRCGQKWVLLDAFLYHSIPFYVFCLRGSGSCRLFGRPHPFRSPGVVTSGDPSDTFHVSISRLQDLSVGCSELRNLGQQKFIRFTSYNFTCCFPWVQTKIFHICYGLGPNTWTIITISILCFKFHTELRALQHLKQKHEATFGHGTYRIPSIPATKMLGKARFRCLARPWGWGKRCEFWRASFFNAR